MRVLAEIDPSDDARIRLSAPLHFNELIKAMPGSRFSHKDNAWKLTKSWTTCLSLRTTFKKDLEIGPRLAAWALEIKTNKIAPALALRNEVNAEGSEKLYPFQRAGVAFLSTAERALLADEMGTGKTRQSIMTLMQLYMSGRDPFPALIVAPNSTKIGWRRETEAVWPGIVVQPIKGSAAVRRKQLETPAHIYVINWEALRTHSRLAPYGSVSLKRCVECGGHDERVTHTKCEVHKRELNQLDFNTVIADEAHRMKDPKSKQTRALWAATGNAAYRYALTGTPIADAPDDLWAILHWLSPEDWPSRTKYIDRVCEVSYNAFGAPTVIGVKHSMRDEFFGSLDPRMRRMPKAVVLPFLPPVMYERRDVEMTPKQKKAYKQMSDQMIAELDDGDMLTTTSPLTRVTRLLQFASSFAELQVDEKTGDRVVRLSDPSCKLDAFMDDLQDFGEDSIVVFAVSRQLIEMLSRRLEKLKIPHGLITGAQNADERQQHMDDFQEGRTKYILCTMAAGGVGITLTRGRIAVFLQRSWSMIDNIQAEARVHRIGSEQHDTITVVDYVTAGTVEEIVIRAVEEKSKRLEEILRDRDLLKKIIEDPDEKDAV